ncbi:DUF2157 domain-containing protein [Woeseia oceani]|uniref:DUF2157 domain-containing protein n=1 Tax=Woeseia oceani TaxID=1548547 RepID=A0A193LGN1_9GAMM|nr:DUF2157 domain-containing protein [Woeseia oceani]ANO51621.1 hypothetical protein BA177_10780 [Woeseia oceani]
MSQEQTASYTAVTEMAIAARFSEAACDRSIEIACLQPEQADWRRYLDRFLMVVGIALIAAGIAAFIAWNWAELDRFAKFAVLQGGILVSAVLAWRFGFDSIAGQSSLFVVAFLTGILLALFGQVYQTGADPYGLFLSWAILILPLCIIGRQAALWLLFHILLILTVIMYYTQVLHPPEGWWQLAQLVGPLVWLGATVLDSTLGSALYLANAIGLVAWELGTSRGVPWMQNRAYPRLIAFGAFSAVLPSTLVMILSASFGDQANLHFISPLLLAITTAGGLWYYQYKQQDLLILTLCLLAAIFVVTSFAIRELVSGSGSLLFLALLIIAEVAGAAWWLKTVAQRWASQS